MYAPPGYSLVFEDRFDGPELDLEKWEYRGTGPAQCGFFAPSEVNIRDGRLVLSGRYREDGQFGPGWYAGHVRVKQRFTRGYFETRCICSEALPQNTLWSAFWLQARHPYEAGISRGGPGGAEVDIVEAFYRDGQTRVFQTIHCSGVSGSKAGPGKIDSHSVGVFTVPNLCTEFHVFGLEWTREDYIFTIDGREVSRSRFGDGVSAVDEELVLTMCLPEKCDHAKDDVREMIVDYVEVYQRDD